MVSLCMTPTPGQVEKNVFFDPLYQPSPGLINRIRKYIPGTAGGLYLHLHGQSGNQPDKGGIMDDLKDTWD